MAQIPRRRPYVARCRASRPLWFHFSLTKKQSKSDSGQPPREAKRQLKPPSKVLAFSGSLLESYYSYQLELESLKKSDINQNSNTKSNISESPSKKGPGHHQLLRKLGQSPKNQFSPSKTVTNTGKTEANTKFAPVQRGRPKSRSPTNNIANINLKKENLKDKSASRSRSRSRSRTGSPKSQTNFKKSTDKGEPLKEQTVPSWLTPTDSDITGNTAANKNNTSTNLFSSTKDSSSDINKNNLNFNSNSELNNSNNNTSATTSTTKNPNPYTKPIGNPYANPSALASNPYTTGFKANLRSANPVTGNNPYANMGCVNSKGPESASANTTTSVVTTTSAVPAGTIGSEATNGAAPVAAAAKAKPKEYSWQKKKSAINKQDYMVMDKENESITRENLELNQFVIDGCKNCDIFVLSPLATVSVDYCENCRIFIGPIESSIFIRNCTNCNISVVCQQFRSRDCLDCKISLFCQTDPIIETSSNMEFSCFCLSYFSLRGDLEKAKINPWSNKWFKIFDFNKREDGVLNYSLVAPYSGKEDSMVEGMGIDFKGKCTNLDFGKEVLESLAGSSSLPPAIPLTLGPLGSATTLSSDPKDRAVMLFLDRQAVDDFLSSVSSNSYTIVQSRVMALDTSKVDRLMRPFSIPNDKCNDLKNNPRLGMIEMIGLDINANSVHEIAEKKVNSSVFVAKEGDSALAADVFFVAIKDDEDMANKIR